MNNRIKIIMIISFSLLLVGGIYQLYNYINAPVSTNTKETSTEASVSSKKLAAMFGTNENMASSKYVEKTLEVEGVIKKITFINDRYSVLLRAENESSLILCDMLPSAGGQIKELKPGETVRLKGVCKGFLIDVIMLNCILVNTLSDE